LATDRASLDIGPYARGLQPRGNRLTTSSLPLLPALPGAARETAVPAPDA
jgi:hypothetical protein